MASETAARPADTSKLGKERWRFVAIALLALAGAAVQLFFIPERLPSLPKQFAELAYARAREAAVALPLSTLNGGQWQQATLVYPGDDTAALCSTLAEGREACEAVFAKPPRELVLLGMQAGKLARIEQIPAVLLQLNGCGRKLDAGQTVRLSRAPNNYAAQLDCQAVNP